MEAKPFSRMSKDKILGGLWGAGGEHLTEFGIRKELPRVEMSKWTSNCDDSQGQFGKKKEEVSEQGNSWYTV